MNLAVRLAEQENIRREFKRSPTVATFACQRGAQASRQIGGLWSRATDIGGLNSG